MKKDFRKTKKFFGNKKRFSEKSYWENSFSENEKDFRKTKKIFGNKNSFSEISFSEFGIKVFRNSVITSCQLNKCILSFKVIFINY